MQAATKSTAAFSLIELLLVIVLLMLLALSASPNLRELWLRHKAQSFMHQLEQQLRYSRVYAISQQRQVRVCPQLGSVCLNNWDLAPLTSTVLAMPGVSGFALQQLAPDPAQFSLSYSREQLIFRPDGSLDLLGSGSFILCARQQMPWHFRLSLSQAGRYRASLVQGLCPR
ncbi:GspH/FimT family protein [Rheinheimera marina]|uniref:Type II secretion system protein H n=1 Tax=Rheinheimera marina TaxID=1774958 RepID=A0ABV9JMS8_9GAMM